MNGVFVAMDISLDADADFLCNDFARADGSDGFKDSTVVRRLFSLPTLVAVDLTDVLEPIDVVLWRADKGTIEKSDSSSMPTSPNSDNIERRGDKSESKGDDPKSVSTILWLGVISTGMFGGVIAVQ